MIKRTKPFNGSAMNSPPTPPYCGSVAAALHLMNSQIRCGSCREKVLFIALRWMQPDRGMMWQAENPELAREFPAGTASKARQSRLHQAQGVFPVFVFHSFVPFASSVWSVWFVFKQQNVGLRCIVSCIVCAGFEAQTLHFVRRKESERCMVGCRVCVWFV